MFIFKLLGTASLIAYTMANPVPDADAKLVKRAEGIHLVNCGTVYSAVIFCNNDGNCNFNPGSGNQCIPPDRSSNGLDKWEGSNQQCTFSTGVTFRWSIRSDAQSQPNFSNVGVGNNGFNQFNIFKDDKHLMYTDGNGNQCRSVYYCLDA